ncbi:hypothetical protein AQUCO_00700177v1 [Aquilegia coerulea]|uniref:Uncharacterized protein n=1 Tax=Aquilegia coerulea TaxID=218851 RepID=A0A2G5EIX1_AQUCA|nr:hypothetical protein AQUCO_00700177v1 [Aquilegia coerulea]
MRSDHMAAFVTENMMRETTTTMMIAPGVGGDEALALVDGGTEVLRGKVVLRGEQRLSNGTGNVNKQDLIIEIVMLRTIIMTMSLHNMVASTMTHNSSRKEDITIDLMSIVWFVPFLFLYLFLSHYCSEETGKINPFVKKSYSPFSTVQVVCRFTFL